MTPVHPIETSGAARSRDRRQSGWRRTPAFQVPDVGPPGDGVTVPALPSAPSLALTHAMTDGDVAAPTLGGEATHAFVDSVARVVRTPQRVTGWFVDLIV